jgi:MinD superfamily P-loop ATPase
MNEIHHMHAHLLLHDAADAVLVGQVSRAAQHRHHRQHDEGDGPRTQPAACRQCSAACQIRRSIAWHAPHKSPTSRTQHCTGVAACHKKTAAHLLHPAPRGTPPHPGHSSAGRTWGCR